MISKGNHFKFANFELLTFSDKAKTITSSFASLNELDIGKLVEDKDGTKYQIVHEGGKEAVC